VAHVEELLEKLGRKERVLELPDGMPNEGPLHDIDAQGPSSAARRQWLLLLVSAPGASAVDQSDNAQDRQ
jgi:hypothetical protein